MRRLGSTIAVALVATASAAACAQIQGLDGYEKVDCLDNCSDGPDGSAIGDGANADNNVQPTNDAETPFDAGNCITGCAPTFTCCENTCVNLFNDEAHCGQCGAPCNGGTMCCNKSCLSVQSNNENCGACGVRCAMYTESCTNGSCQVLLVGDGADGAFAPNTDATINTVLAGITSAAANQAEVTVTDATGFAPLQLVFLHQTRGNGAGAYEYATIESISGNKLVMAHNLSRAYTSAGDVDRSQVVRVHRYSTVTIPAGVTVTAPAWDGTKGGILVYKASGAVQINGAIDMSGRGFRGFSHASVCAGGMLYVCNAANTANGFSGESAAGPSGNANAANGAGGGGGQDGQDCAGGGGGAYGAAGAAGANGDGLVCRNGPQLGGAAGAVAGSTDLRTSVLFGGAGGEGGGDEDGAYPGPGGNGGGIVFIDALSISVGGAIRSNGTAGSNGVQNGACGGAGCGMGGGGGGAGGAVRLRAMTTASLGSNLVTASGANGGGCTCDSSRVGGVAGAGRIGISATITGTTSPTFDPN